MQVTDAMVAKAAESDAEFDGRTWLAMPKSERERYMERSRRSLTAALAEMWRPIEEAPKDGTRVLLFTEQFDPPTIQAQWKMHDMPYEYGEWVDVWNNDPIETNAGPIRPTHFMPLPVPPRGRE